MASHSWCRSWSRLLLAGCLASVGCGGPPPPAPPRTLAPEVAARIKVTEVKCYLPQEGLEVNVFDPRGDGTSVNPNPEEVRARVKAATKEESDELVKQLNVVAYEEPFWAAIFPVLKETAWLKAGEPKMFKGPLVEVGPTARGAILVIEGKYAITEDTRTLFSQTALDFYLDGQRAAVNIATYQSARVGPEPGARAISRWIADDRAAYRKAVDESIAENAKMTRYILQEMEGNPPKALKTATIKFGFLVRWTPDGDEVDKYWQLPVLIIEQTKERVVFQVTGAFMTGWYFSLPADDIEW